MKGKNPLRKFYINKSAMVLLILLTILSFIVWVGTMHENNMVQSELESEELTADEKKEVLSRSTWKKSVSDIALVAFTVFAGALFTCIIVEPRNSNKIVENVFVDDFLTSDKFMSILGEERQKQLLSSLEKQLYFGGSKEKAEMYRAIKEKLNTPLKNHDLFYEEYSMQVTCRIMENYIEKTIVKDVKLKSIDSAKNIKDFVFVAGCHREDDDFESLEITHLSINDDNKTRKDYAYRQTAAGGISGNQGQYNERIDCLYKGTLNFSNKKPIRIETQYITRCPIDDLVFGVRLPYPCKRFSFIFSVEGDDYVINPSAFGFIDDGKDSPNIHGDRKQVTIRFNDWIFPLDGVCICLENSCKNEKNRI